MSCNTCLPCTRDLLQSKRPPRHESGRHTFPPRTCGYRTNYRQPVHRGGEWWSTSAQLTPWRCEVPARPRSLSRPHQPNRPSSSTTPSLPVPPRTGCTFSRIVSHFLLFFPPVASRAVSASLAPARVVSMVTTQTNYGEPFTSFGGGASKFVWNWAPPTFRDKKVNKSHDNTL